MEGMENKAMVLIPYGSMSCIYLSKYFFPRFYREALRSEEIDICKKCKVNSVEV